jgi:hypothetical protein
MTPMSDELLAWEGNDDLPSVDTVLLPSRAMLRSWREQTLPARRFAIDDALEHFRSVPDNQIGLRDMALLAVISESMQVLEDLAYLGTAWDKPFTGLPNYVRSITFGKFVANSFWQGVHKWDDLRVGVFAGFYGRDPADQGPADILDGFRETDPFTLEHRGALEAARQAAIARVRGILIDLGRDWQQFSPYFLAFKHGALAINRDDTAFVDDEVEEVTDETLRHHPSVAIWTRGVRRDELKADFAMTPNDVADAASGSGRLAASCLDAFVTSRLALVEAVEFSSDGAVVGLRNVQIPWTHWLRAGDLTEEHWATIGRGPRIRWVPRPEELVEPDEQDAKNGETSPNDASEGAG